MMTCDRCLKQKPSDDFLALQGLFDTCLQCRQEVAAESEAALPLLQYCSRCRTTQAAEQFFRRGDKPSLTCATCRAADVVKAADARVEREREQAEGRVIEGARVSRGIQSCPYCHSRDCRRSHAA